MSSGFLRLIQEEERRLGQYAVYQKGRNFVPGAFESVVVVPFKLGNLQDFWPHPPIPLVVYDESGYKKNTEICRELKGSMEIEFILIADAVENVNGKLYVMGGGWSIFRSSSFPAQARFGIAVSVIISREETQAAHDIHINIAENSRRTQAQTAMQQAESLDIDGKIQVAHLSGLDEHGTQRAFLALNGNLPIPHAGKYRVTAIAGKASKSVDFEAKLVTIN
jgi:hypothetical protein